MKIKVNLNKLTPLEKGIELISEQVQGETNYQGLPIYQPESITGAIYFDKEAFVQLCLEANRSSYNKLIFGEDLVFFAKINVICNNGMNWEIDVVGEPKIHFEDESIIYFDRFEVI